MRKYLRFIFLLFCLSILVFGKAIGQTVQDVIVINAGVGGNNTVQLIKRIEKDVISQQSDLTILMVGTNDMLNSNKMITYQEYSTNLKFIVKKLKDADSEVLLMSSPPVDSTYLLQRHDRSLFKQAPNDIMDSVSHIVSAIALENDVFFLNLNEKFSKLNLPKHNEDLFFKNKMNSGRLDGVHPTDLGYYFIAKNIFQFLKEKQLLNKYSKIICFGDSITIGGGTKGKVSLNENNYPSFLFRMIQDYLSN